MKFSHQLQKIMSHFGLSTTELADKILVPKATISHLISERNKPSLEFIMKLHTHFPSLNLEWLIYGREPFLINETVSSNETNLLIEPTSLVKENVILETTKEEIVKENVAPFENNSDEKIVTAKESNPSFENNFDEKVEIQKNILSFPDKSSEKKIEAIVFFYTDGSFKRFTSE